MSLENKKDKERRREIKRNREREERRGIER